jgi:hypothetical protein
MSAPARLDQADAAFFYGEVARGAGRVYGFEISRNTVGADGRVKTKYLWPEIADGSRTLFQLPLRSRDSACTGFTGLDHIVVSGPLHAALEKHAPADIGTRKAPVLGRVGQLIESSDHCPQIGRLML